MHYYIIFGILNIILIYEKLHYILVSNESVNMDSEKYNFKTYQ